MLDAVRQTMARYEMCKPGDAVVVGISGGADSVALLLVLLQLRGESGPPIYAVHVNHQLRGADADADEDFTSAICSQWGVPLRIFQADVRGLAAAEKLSLEEAGRRLRYDCFQQALTEFGAQKIAVAHNRDDNAETVLLNLFRGAGLAGLGGIAPVRGPVVRPLIEIPRADIEAFLAEQGVPYRTDASNFDPGYTRNRIRHTVMPVITAQTHPAAAAVIARNTALLRDDEAYLTQAAQAALKDCRCPAAAHSPEGVWLDISKLAALPPALARRVLREGVRQTGDGTVTDVNAAQIEQVLHLIEGETGRQIQLSHHARAVKVYDKLALFREKRHVPRAAEPSTPTESCGAFCLALVPDLSVYVPALGKNIVISLNGPCPAAKDGCTKTFCYDKMSAIPTLRTRRPGDRIYLDGVGRRKLQDYFTDRKIPRAQRDTIPLLADGSDIIWIMDGHDRINGRYKPVPGHALLWVSVYGTM